ncbi:MAG TPA: DNA polymerase III subunit delta [Verrucomicrobiales bacterium]|nr:DNA polymerase III subunit delta [Verrucomicrobiales bacterium]
MPAKKSAKTKEASVSAGVWAYLGTDDLRVKEAALAKTREITPPEAGEFGIEIIEGGADNADHAARIVRNTMEALQTLPFFGGEKVVWLKGVSFLADNQTGRAQSTVSALEDLMALLVPGLPPDVKFVLSASEVDKRRSFYLNLKKVANVEVFDLIDTSKQGWEELVAQLVEQRAEEYGLEFEAEALDLFTMLAGEDTRQIENELVKLDLYLGDERRVRPDDVRSIVSQTKSGVVFELGNAIGQRQLAYALALVDQLLEEDEAPIGILLAAIVPKVRNLFAAKQIEERYKIRPGGSYQSYAAALERLPAQDVARLPKKKDGSGLNVFPLFLAAKEAAKFSGAELRIALEECLKANRRLVTTSLDPVIVLNQLLFRILAGKN